MNQTLSPTVSVVITCYNYGHYLSGCLDSVLAQTYKDYEIIVVDDGSTDDTADVMSSYAEMKNIRYIRQKNGGQAKAKNRGIKESKGAFIAFLDADDLWREDKLEKQMPLFSDPDVGVVYSRALLIDGDGKALNFSYEGKYLIPQRGRVVNWLFLDNFVWFSSSIVRKECFNTHGCFDETLQMGIDWDRWLRFSVHYQFDFVDEPLLYYRHGHSGQMSKNLDTRYQCAARIMEAFLRDNPGHLAENIKKEAYFLTYCNRGLHYRSVDKLKSIQFYLKALKLKPFKSAPYKGFVKIFVGSEGDGCIFSQYKEYRHTIHSDLYRYCGSNRNFIKNYLETPGFHYTFWLRTAFFTKNMSKLFYPFYLLSRLRLRSLQYKYGISIPYNTSIGKGLYIGHFGGIIVNHEAVIGNNCNLNQGVTIGATYGGKNPGVPVIGDNVYIGPGSFVIGGIKLGHNVAIGANTVVTKDVPDSGVVASIPGDVISLKGSGNYIVNTDY